VLDQSTTPVEPVIEAWIEEIAPSEDTSASAWLRLLLSDGSTAGVWLPDDTVTWHGLHVGQIIEVTLTESGVRFSDRGPRPGSGPPR
jgi:hypothetical protein